MFAGTLSSSDGARQATGPPLDPPVPHHHRPPPCRTLRMDIRCKAVEVGTCSCGLRTTRVYIRSSLVGRMATRGGCSALASRGSLGAVLPDARSASADSRPGRDRLVHADGGTRLFLAGRTRMECLAFAQFSLADVAQNTSSPSRRLPPLLR
ncbi:hypothetical protein BJY59DRAFT_64406 [Rhodotorula toruloides]